MVEISWVAYSYFKRLVLLFFSVLILLMMVVFIYTLGGSILRWVVPFLRSYVDDRRVDRDVTNIYHLNFLIRIILNKVALLSTL